MINKIMSFNPNDFVIPRLTIRYKKKIMPGLKNLFNHLLNFYLPLSKNELDTEYFEVFSEYITIRLLKHIAEAIGSERKPNNA
jgi:hypothetical protein